MGQPLAVVPLYGCRIPLAGKECAQETQEGEIGEAPPGRIKRACFEETARLAAHQGRESFRRDGVFRAIEINSFQNF